MRRVWGTRGRACQGENSEGPQGNRRHVVRNVIWLRGGAAGRPHDGARPEGYGSSARFVEGDGGGGGAVESGSIVYAAEPGVGAPREIPVELWDNET